VYSLEFILRVLIMERRLLSELDGKISHILLAYSTFEDFPRIESLVKVLDDDVRITIFYNENNPLESQYDERRHFWKRLLHQKREGLEKVVDLQKDSKKQIDLVTVEDEISRWVQDRVHVFEDKILMPSTTKELSDSRLAERNPRNIWRNNLMFEHPFWQDLGFRVIPYDIDLYNTDGGDLIPFGDTLFAGSYLSTEFLYHDMHGKGNQSMQFAEREVRKRLKKLDTTRDIRFIGANGKPLLQHIDLFFTPDEGYNFIADVQGTMKMVNLPPGFYSDRQFKFMRRNMQKLVGRLSEDSVRLPCMLPQMFKGSDGPVEVARTLGNRTYLGTNLIPFCTFNNVIRERYVKDGVEKKVVYLPFYSPDVSLVELCGDEMIDNKILALSIHAKSYYEKKGYEVRTVDFPSVARELGSLRCSTKVLRRR